MPGRGDIEMEERFAFQERELEQLGRVVAEQQLELDALQRELVQLRARVEKVRQSAGTDETPRTLEDDRPPHY